MTSTDYLTIGIVMMFGGGVLTWAGWGVVGVVVGGFGFGLWIVVLYRGMRRE